MTTIPEEELEFRFYRAGGPGGQNVNKVATAVQMRFDVRNSPSLTEPVKTRLMKLAGSRLTLDGVIVISAVRFRTQARNAPMRWSGFRRWWTRPRSGRPIACRPGRPRPPRNVG